MLLKFTLSDRTLILNNPKELISTEDYSFIQCRIELKSRVFKASDVIVAVCKSASYNIKEEVLFNTSFIKEDDEVVKSICFGFIPAKVFEHGGVIQVLLYKKLSNDGRKVQDATNTVEFYLDPKKYVPLTVPQLWQYIASDVAEIQEIIDAGVDYEDIDNKPSIEGVTLIGNKTYPELNLAGLTNIEIEEMLQ